MLAVPLGELPHRTILEMGLTPRALVVRRHDPSHARAEAGRTRHRSRVGEAEVLADYRSVADVPVRAAQ